MNDQPCLISSTNEYLFIYKPCGYHSAKGQSSESVASWLSKNYPQFSAFGRSPQDEGLINRLDFETSGILVGAKSNDAKDKFVKASEHGFVEKNYFFISDRLKEGSWGCDEAIGQKSRNSKRVKTESQSEHLRDTQSSYTSFSLHSKGDAQLYKATIFNGRRHQIRVHAEVSNVPLLNDTLYSGSKNDFLKDAFVLFHYALTSEKLGFDVTCPIELSPYFIEATKYFKIEAPL